MSDIQKQPEHINPIARSISEHIPAAGDIYITKTPNRYSTMYRIDGEASGRPGYYMTTRLDPLTGEPTQEGEGSIFPSKDSISGDQLRLYYRYLSCDLTETMDLARKVIYGDAASVRLAVLGSDEDNHELSEETALASGRTAREVGEMLLQAEVRQNRLQEVKLAAELIATAKRNELEYKLRVMNDMLSSFGEKVRDLVRVVTILNLYLGKEVTVEQVSDGEVADPAEPLHLRQRILYMDEELCAHIEHEADYKDIGLFVEWLKEPANRDIIVPEKRCIVAMKPKRFDMGYRSGDSYYDAAREAWNKHTYLILRNGERLYLVDDDDLDCRDWMFPHKDHEITFAAKMADPGTPFKDSLEREHKDENYRAMRLAMLQKG